MGALKATPGPWWVDDRRKVAANRGGGAIQVMARHRGEGSSYCVASVNFWEVPEANARLIAAAPDGYALAERLIAHLRDDFRIPADADEGWIVDSLGHGLGGVYLDALAFAAKARGEVA